jgi:hypothetical protein
MSEKKYRRIRTDFFNHPKTAPLSLPAKLLFFYLTTPHAAGISCKSTTQMRNGIDVNTPIDVIRAALKELVDAGAVMWDEAAELVWVIEAFDEQVVAVHERHPNMAKAVMAYLDTLPPSPVKRAFFQRYGSWLRDSGARVPAGPPALRVIGPAPPATADESGKGSIAEQSDPFGNQEQKQVQEQEQNQRARATDQSQSSRQHREDCAPSNTPSAPPGPEPDHRTVERRLMTAFEHALASPASPEMVKGAMERWYEGDATVDELERVVAWWRDNREEASCYLRQCFQRFGGGCQWARMAAIVLGRKPGQRGRRRANGPPSSAMAGNAAKWEAIKAEPPPELDEEFLALPDRVGIGGDT